MSDSSPVNRSTSRRYTVFFLIASLFVLLVFLLIALVTGNRSGEEFSPDDFSRRSYTYNKDPIFGFIISGIKYTSSSTKIDKQLVMDGLIKPTNVKNKTWMLLRDSRSMLTNNRLPQDCDARFLTNYLDKTNEDYDNFWMIWNAEYPKTAKVFWPVIAKMAREDMYIKIPDVMDFAMSWELEQEDPVAFKSQLDELTADAYFELGEIDSQLNRTARAKSRLKTSIAIHPTSRAKKLLQSIQ